MTCRSMLPEEAHRTALRVAILTTVAALVLIYGAPACTPSFGRPLFPGAWSHVAESTADFLSSQNRPNQRPWTGEHLHDSCCGPADGYESDLFEYDAESGELAAIVTEGDTPEKAAEAEAAQPYCAPDENSANCKPRVPAGTRFIVPKDRIVLQDPAHPNTTGHGWIWLGSGKNVFCYTYPAGV